MGNKHGKDSKPNTMIAHVSSTAVASQCSNQKNITLGIEPYVDEVSLKGHLFEKER